VKIYIWGTDSLLQLRLPRLVTHFLRNLQKPGYVKKDLRYKDGCDDASLCVGFQDRGGKVCGSAKVLLAT
jgi:hypothetical protein